MGSDSRKSMGPRSGLVLAALGACVVVLFLLRTSGRGQEAKEPCQRVVFLGDSIFRGARFDLSVPTLNHGVDGQTTRQILERFESGSVDARPGDCVFILAGTNDVAEVDRRTFSKRATLANLAELVKGVTAAGARPILCTVLPATSYPWAPHIGNVAETIAAVNDEIRALAESRGIALVSWPEAMRSPAFYTDGVHPNQRGYREMEQTLKSQIA